jgi:hypothetical protein
MTDRSRLTWLLVAVAAVIALIAVAQHHPDRPTASAQAVAVDPVADLHRPSDPLVDLSPTVPGWRTFAFVSKEGTLCGGSASTTTTNHAVACWVPVYGGTPGDWIALPAFQVLPPPDAVDGKVYVIGVMRCDATEVEVTFRFETTLAQARPIPGTPGLRVYTALLPIHGATTYGTNDISALVPRKNGELAACTRLS